eukprot:CAMPEP_0168331914 /NCGR_PEP_ID=MMETSP0213-20121227/8627_1 /TAXON_ID=151035 /ORGANISM="Euplotes harpa, Strain FSP1.4" /LENGTH=125 /DNA_ID=CAMNT_0008335801 /DNA_START=376 /DNA_END=753 /DNA_ORIENTATION=+
MPVERRELPVPAFGLLHGSVDIRSLSETQMIDRVRQIDVLLQSVDDLAVRVGADVEVTWDSINLNVASEYTSFVIVKSNLSSADCIFPIRRHRVINRSFLEIFANFVECVPFVDNVRTHFVLNIE